MIGEHPGSSRLREPPALLRGTDDAQYRLDEPVGEGFSTTYVTLHGLIQHDLYHTGQIAILKKAGEALGDGA